MFKKWIANKKLALAHKWARQLGLYVVQIRVIAGTEYLVATDGSVRKLARG